MSVGLLELHRRAPVNKQAPRRDRRTLFLSKYSAGLAPAPPAWSLPGVPATTPTYYGNDAVGDCTKAAWAGLTYGLSTAAGSPFNYTDAQVLQMYEDCDGYRLGVESTDNGSDGLTSLKFFSASGAYGHAPAAYLAASGDADDLRTAARYFGGLYLGVALPRAWQGTTEWGTSPFGFALGKWAPGSWGGHMVWGKPSYTTDYLEILTWAATYRMTWRAAATYLDERWAVVSRDFKSPDGFDDVALAQDLSAVRGA